MREADARSGRRLAGASRFKGAIEPIDSNGRLSVTAQDGGVAKDAPFPVRDHGDAAGRLIPWLTANHALVAADVALIACRIVHGGDRYREATLVQGAVLDDIERLDELAPLHNAASAAILRAMGTTELGGRPAVAVFDTAFHSTIPEVAYRYGIDWELAERHGIRRFGFHGTSHQYLALRYCELTATPLAQANIVSLHLGAGSSVTAIKNGKSIDTSMGFTPLEGLMMGTRSGDIDASIVGYLARKEGVSVAEVERWLNKRSGLLGVSGRSQDTRVLSQHAATDHRAQLALEMFAYRAKKYTGAYLAALGGASAIVFGGGIGENSPDVRRLICEGLEWFGLSLDPEKNARTIDAEGRITKEGSRLHAYVIPTQESLMIAHEAVRAFPNP